MTMHDTNSCQTSVSIKTLQCINIQMYVHTCMQCESTVDTQMGYLQRFSNDLHFVTIQLGYSQLHSAVQCNRTKIHELAQIGFQFSIGYVLTEYFTCYLLTFREYLPNYMSRLCQCGRKNWLSNFKSSKNPHFMILPYFAL